MFIANPDIADVQVKSPSLIYISAKQPGETVIYAVDASDNVLLHSPVHVDHDLSRVRDSMHRLMPGEDISVSSVDNSLVLSGNVSTAGRAEKARALAASVAQATDVKNAVVVNQLAVNTPNQVNLRVKIAEVNRTALKALGFQWSKSPVNCNAAGSSLGGIACGTTSNLLTSVANPLTNQSIGTANEIAYGIPLPGSSSRLEAIFDALAQESLITTLAEPNLTATLRSDGLFPRRRRVPRAGRRGLDRDHRHAHTPRRFQDLRRRARLHADDPRREPSEPQGVARSQPADQHRRGLGADFFDRNGVDPRADCPARRDHRRPRQRRELCACRADGEHHRARRLEEFPGFGDVPGDPASYSRSNLFQHNETELVIIVTPYLVRPSQTVLAAPTDGFILPHDAERYAYSDTYKQTLPGPQRGPLPAGGQQGLIGPVGFRLD